MKYISWIFGTIIVLGTVASIVIASGNSLDVINPTGYIAQQELNVLIFATLLSLVVIIPVFVITIYISLKYSSKNKNTRYEPDWDSSSKAEATWWAIPIILIFFMSIVTWQSTFALDPYKALESDKQPIKVQVIAMEWKWLFIYPEYGIASLNYLQIPVDTPINFEITSDAPMNSLWIPSLGGQVYAMKGMQTKLHLLSNETGEVTGRSSNISGEGFADMHFVTNTTNDDDFEKWTSRVARDGLTLNIFKYEQLAEPSIEKVPIYYTDIEPRLFNTIIDKYMHGGH